MAVLKMREATTHRPVYMPSDEISLVEAYQASSQARGPHDYACPFQAYIYRKGVANGVKICVESLEALDALMEPDVEVTPCDESVVIDPSKVKFAHVPV